MFNVGWCVWNTAAEITVCAERHRSITILGIAKRLKHTTPLLRQLHWLKDPERIKFRLCVLIHRCLHNKLCGRPPQYAPASYVTLTFHLLTLKVVSESRVTWATSLPIIVFLLPRPLCCRFRPDVRDRQTDRQTSDAHHRLMPTRRGHNKTPPYLAETLHLTTEVDTRHRLRSASTSTHSVPSTRRSTIGDRTFPVAAACAWNSLPSSVRTVSSLDAFLDDLKTVLFKTSFE